MKPRIINFPTRHAFESTPVPIVNDALITSRGIHGGRMLPLLLLDLSKRLDVAELIRVHKSLGPGDASTQWGYIPQKGHEEMVALFLTFIRPIDARVVLEFNIVKQGCLVEQTLIGQGLYIAEAKGPDDRLKNDPQRPSLLVEVSNTGFRKVWDDLFRTHLSRDFRNRGMARSESRRAARSAVERWRELGNLKMRDIHE